MFFPSHTVYQLFYPHVRGSTPTCWKSGSPSFEDVDFVAKHRVGTQKYRDTVLASECFNMAVSIS